MESGVLFCLFVLLIATVDKTSGARMLKQVQGRVSATTGGSPGSTGSVQLSFSGPTGSFSQTVPTAGPSTVQFTSDNGGSLSIGAAGQPPQIATNLITGAALAPLPPIDFGSPAFNFPPIDFPAFPPIPALNSSFPPLPPLPDVNDTLDMIIARLNALLRRNGIVLERGSDGRLTTKFVDGGPVDLGVNVAPIQQSFTNQGGGVTRVNGASVGQQSSFMQTGPGGFQASSSSSGPNAVAGTQLSIKSVSGR